MRVALWLLQDSIQQWSSWIAGLYYVQHCVEALATLPASESPQVVAFFPESLGPKVEETLSWRSFPWLTLVPIADRLLQEPHQQDHLAALIDGYACDLVFPVMVPPVVALSGRVIGWITDFQHKVYPDFFSPEELTYRDKLFAFLGAICDRMVCSSHSVAADLQRFLPDMEDRHFVLRFTVQPPPAALAVDCQATLQRLGLSRPYAYLPYQFWAHKNHRRVFEAWQILASRGHRFPLICSGATVDPRRPEHVPSLVAFLTEHQLDDCVRVLGLVDRQDQWQLYRGAKLVLQPSLFEGWSTSVEEARSLGKPIVLSDIPVHREQMGDTGHYFPAEDPILLADLIETLWERLPDANNLAQEHAALRDQEQRVQAFGRQLLGLFQQTLAFQRERVAAQVLPLYTLMHEEAKQRLTVIQRLSTRIQELERAVAASRGDSEGRTSPNPAQVSEEGHSACLKRGWRRLRAAWRGTHI